MELICILPLTNLTFGKKYKVTRLQEGYHFGSDKPLTGLWVIDDTNRENHYSRRRFLNISDWRESQINKII